MPDVPSSVVGTDTVQINMMVDSTADSEWSIREKITLSIRECFCGLAKITKPLFIALAFLAIPFLLVTPLVTSILQIVLASEAIEKYTNNTKPVFQGGGEYHFDGTDSAKGFSMIHDGNIFISASYPVVLCVFFCGYFSLILSAVGQVDTDSLEQQCCVFFLICSLTVPSISTVVVFVKTSPIAPEFYSSDLHVARMLALVTSSIKLFFIILFGVLYILAQMALGDT